MIGPLVILVGMLLIVHPLLGELRPLPDILARVMDPLRPLYPVTKDDGLFDAMIDQLEEVSR